MERPKPTKELILELTGYDEGLISAVHHGLNETPLHEFYPYLDLDELVAFEASSWKSREKDITLFEGITLSQSIYGVFSEVYDIGMPWLKKNKEIPEKLKSMYSELNPFKGKNLKARLERVDPEAVKILKEKLLEPVNKYVFEGQYHDEKMRAKPRGENYGIKVMEFQPYHPEKGKIVPNFAKEISKMLSSYPVGYEPLTKSQLPLL